MELSKQQLLDCSWGYGNFGCRGGQSWKALKWIQTHGVATRASYGRYLEQVGLTATFCERFIEVEPDI